jgi:hypothetical protein
MQPQQEPQDWQQPPQAPPAPPYQAVVPEQGAVPPANEPTPREDDGQPEGSTEPVEHALNSSSSEDAPVQIDDSDTVGQEDQDDQPVLRWRAAEYVQQEQSSVWFIMLGVVVVALMAIAFFLMQSITFAILIPIMAVALIVYIKRPAAVHDYTISRKGLHVDDRLFGYDQYRAFGVISRDNKHAVVLIPRKRFQLGHTVYFPEDVGESLVDMLAARLPMKDIKPDFIDNLLVRLRL